MSDKIVRKESVMSDSPPPVDNWGPGPPCDGVDSHHTCSDAHGYYTLVYPNGRVRHFCDTDCLRYTLDADYAAFEAELRAEIAGWYADPVMCAERDALWVELGWVDGRAPPPAGDIPPAPRVT